jgi:hypothetical protein
MRVVKSMKLFVLPLAFAATQSNAATINYSLDQPKPLFDDVGYAPVSISDSTTTVDDIDLSVELIASTPTASDSNFDPSLSVHASKIAVTAPEVIVLFGSALISLVVLVRYKRSV